MSWKKVKLGELVDNFSVRAKDVGGAEGLDFFGVSNSEGIIKTKYAAEDKAEDYKIIEKDCFAYNPYRVNVGSIGMVADNIRGLISPAYVIFKPKPNTIKAELLYKFLKSSEGLRQIKFYARGTVRQALRFEDLCNIELSIPSYNEQEILFEKLNNTQLESELLSNELTHQLTLVKKLRQQLLQDAVQGKLVKQNPNDETASELLKKIKAEKETLRQAQGDKKVKKEKELPHIKPEEIPFEIPENWLWCRLGEILDILTDYHANGAYEKLKNNVSMTDEEDYAIMLRTTNFHAKNYFEYKYISQEAFNFLEKSKVYSGDLIMNKIGDPGTVFFVDDRGKPMSLAMNLFLLRLNRSISNYYIYSYLKLQQAYIKSFAAGSTSMTITKDAVKELLVPLPPLAEQHRIVQKLDELMQCCNDLEASIKKSQQQNEKLLQQVLREALRGESVEN
jgi:type I restriction enzyme S subunit